MKGFILLCALCFPLAIIAIDKSDQKRKNYWIGTNTTVATNIIVEGYQFLMVSKTNMAEDVVGIAKDYGWITNLVNTLTARGEICAIKGHQWRGGRPGESEGCVFADYHPNTVFRTCNICGICQSQTLEWK